jgi:hypothetical protein
LVRNTNSPDFAGILADLAQVPFFAFFDFGRPKDKSPPFGSTVQKQWRRPQGIFQEQKHNESTNIVYSMLVSFYAYPYSVCSMMNYIVCVHQQMMVSCMYLHAGICKFSQHIFFLQDSHTRTHTHTHTLTHTHTHTHTLTLTHSLSLSLTHTPIHHMQVLPPSHIFT